MQSRRSFMIKTAMVLAALPLAGFSLPDFRALGKNPDGARLDRVRQSPNYRDGSFQNLSPTEMMLENASRLKMMKDFLNKPATTVPPQAIPALKPNLRNLPQHDVSIVWFGHSSYLIHSRGFTILVDPVFSGNASPVKFFGKAFEGTGIYDVNDFPNIDLVLITHDHYDHLDYPTILQLKERNVPFIVPLGVGQHLEHWGVPPEKFTELDWWESHNFTADIKITAAPARHFSGRSFKRNQTLWASYVLQLHGRTILAGGDSGYDTHYKTIGEKFGPFDLAILECGQYGENWPYIHMLPEETVQAALDLHAKALLPVHWSKFALSLHPWNEPVKRVVKAAEEKKLPIATPQLGEPLQLSQAFRVNRWWDS